MHRCPFLDRRFNRCLQADLASISSCTKHQGVGSSDKRHSLSSLEPKSLRMIILTIILVQVLCCHSITKITRNGINGATFVSRITFVCVHGPGAVASSMDGTTRTLILNVAYGFNSVAENSLMPRIPRYICTYGQTCMLSTKYQRRRCIADHTIELQWPLVVQCLGQQQAIASNGINLYLEASDMNEFRSFVVDPSRLDGCNIKS